MSVIVWQNEPKHQTEVYLQQNILSPFLCQSWHNCINILKDHKLEQNKNNHWGTELEKTKPDEKSLRISFGDIKTDRKWISIFFNNRFSNFKKI